MIAKQMSVLKQKIFHSDTSHAQKSQNILARYSTSTQDLKVLL
jgi:hypothetical protein